MVELSLIISGLVPIIVATFNFLTKDNQRTSNLRDAFPEIPTDNIPNCSEIGTLNSIVGIIGIMQANEVLKIVLGFDNILSGKLLCYNAKTTQINTLTIHKSDSEIEKVLARRGDFINDTQEYLRIHQSLP